MSEYAALIRPAAARPPLPRRARPPAPHRPGPDADRPRRRPLLEGVREPDRARARRGPTADTIEWLAERLGVDASFLEIGVSSSERERVESVVARAEAAIESSDYGARASRSSTSSPPRSATIAVPELDAPRAASPRPGRACTWARSASRSRSSTAAAGSPRRRRSPTSTAPRSSTGSAAAATSSTRSRPPWRSTRRPSSSSSAPAFPPTASARTSTSGAPAATGASATGRRRARTSSAHSSSPKASTTGTRWGTSYFQASLVAERTGHWVLARSLRREGAGPSTRSSATSRTSGSS